MASSIAKAVDDAHPVSLQKVRPTMAKVGLKKVQDDEREAFGQAYGRVLERVPQLLGLSKKEFAARLGVEPNQLAAWFSGKENPQMWRFHRDYAVRGALLLAHAEAHEGARVRMSIDLEQQKVG